MTRSVVVAVLGVAVLLLIASRVPLLLAHPDYGLFDPERIWIFTDPGVAERWSDATGEPATGVDVNPGVATGYHGGDQWVLRGVELIGRVTGGYSMLEQKLLGLVATIVAMIAYLTALIRVFPTQPARWLLPLWIVWLAPPALLLWMTVLPMGLYLETWLFHALFLPPAVRLLESRPERRFLVVLALCLGVATVYSLSNLAFVLFFALLLLLGTGRISDRLADAAILVATSSVAWLTVGIRRLGAVRSRLAAPTDGLDLRALFDRVVANLGMLNSPELVAQQHGFIKRGVFATLDPRLPQESEYWSFALEAACGLGALYLSVWAIALLLPRTRRRLDLPQRFLGAQGLFLWLVFAAWAVWVDGDVGGAANYFASCYPALLFGLAQGAAALVGSRWLPVRLLGAVPVVGLLGLLSIGWLQASEWNMRPLDRQGVQAQDFLTLGSFAAIGREELIGPQDLRSLCERAYPKNTPFCEQAAWITVIQASSMVDEERPEPIDYDRCQHVPPEDAAACVMGALSRRLEQAKCDSERTDEDRGFTHLCAGFAPELRQACLTGLYRNTVGQYQGSKCFDHAVDLCSEDLEPWRRRACLEVTSSMVVGMPPMPLPSDAELSSRCQEWPRDWSGLCSRYEAARPVAPGAVSCEEVYLERWAEEVPVRNSLLVQQCVNRSLYGGRSFALPSCIVGMARALEGLDCSWAGSDLEL
jgi:hypothetical protein